MKVFKIALLGAAALSAVSVGARADNLSDLKTQIETLNARVASLETAPALPAGYQMVSFSKVGEDHVISIMPTADMPASTEIKWNGSIRAGIEATFDPTKSQQYSVDVWTSARLKVVAKTDTAVGEVGVNIGMRAVDLDARAQYNYGQSAVQTDSFYGWWKMTPNLTLSGGTMNPYQKGTLAKNSYSFDAVCTCFQGDAWGAIANDPAKGNALVTTSTANPAQMTLTYADGPLGLAVSLEDSNNGNNTSALGGTAKATYKMDSVGFDVSGGYWGNAYGNAAWNVNAGVGFNLSPVKFGATIGTGNIGDFGSSYDYTAASGYAVVALSSQASAEFGISHDFGSASGDKYAGATLYAVGLYYTPVKQLVLGVEGNYQTGGTQDTAYTADLVSVFKF